MGSCLSVEREEHRQRESNSSCGKPGSNGGSKSPVKSGSVSASTFVIIPKNVKDLRLSPGNGDLDIFTYEEMKLATKHFRPDQVLGEGGFGIVYKGVIDESVRPGYKTTQIAVKVLDPESLQGDREWLVRVRATLTWHRRLKIALDTARGLAFLHGVEKPIIYRDFKTSNILLDEVRHLTARSDIYGFGVVLLEMLIGRRAMDKSRPSREHNLVEWARPLLNHSKKLSRILDPRIGGQYSTKILMKVANLAYQCLSQNPKGRPLMSQVIEILEPLVTQELSPTESGGTITLYEVQKDTPQNPNGG
ncbi:hypothetical protein SASPL_129683 [Salvia splendens]|uniref:Protein kinase domain-containing protein n=1 Tax=Salvia splendens TaxID=180675 RepID=A0A8X8XBR5_SALSN|nr:hypothetical protein SASPL_129683 [Salvia splendens]